MQEKIKDSVYIRCNDKIKEDDTGFLNVEDIARFNRIQIDKLLLDYEHLASFFSRFMAHISLHSMGYRAIGSRSGLYINPEKADVNQLGILINNSNKSVLEKSAIRSNLKQILNRNYPEHQMAYDNEGNLITEKTIDEIIEELRQAM